jgi:protein TonB
VITADENVSEEEEIKTQDEMTQTSINISIADVQGVDTEDAQDIADFQEVIAEPEPEEEKPFEAVEQMPQFPGGDAALMKYISSNLNYPPVAAENGIQGRVILRFVVSKTGEIGNIQVLRSPDPSLEKEAIRVVKSMPQWVPGKQNGVSVPVYFTLPVTFRLQ